MRRLMLVLSLALSIVGCVSAPAPGPYVLSATSAAPTECTLVEQHQRQDGEIVEAAYNCPSMLVVPYAAKELCSNIQGYFRKDGIYIPSHQRCKTTAFASIKTPAPLTGSTNAPCVTGYCGPVQVKGYYRKDGTYVRPHTRSRRK